MNQRKLIDIDELSESLSIPQTTIYSWRHQGAIPQQAMLKVRGKLLFDPIEIEKWINSFRGAEVV
jgi:predicted DNA-binding transcriptional regulator AlpA